MTASSLPGGGGGGGFPQEKVNYFLSGINSHIHMYIQLYTL